MHYMNLSGLDGNIFSSILDSEIEIDNDDKRCHRPRSFYRIFINI